MKFAVTTAIVEYAVEQTSFHILMSNANLSRSGRSNVLRYFREQGFTVVIVSFELPTATLISRIEASDRSKAIFRQATSFLEVLERQEAANPEPPTEEEADKLFVIRSPDDVEAVIRQIKAFEGGTDARA